MPVLLEDLAFKFMGLRREQTALDWWKIDEPFSKGNRLGYCRFCFG
ncbi:MAG: hypothetical protein IAX21_00050 [Candidatus Bathyarchaeota archaeon]|nr:hypothetical protein [Candidatus Bathyarchaeum tardum]WGM90625.1 MAG: hypothetical protein NUK63_05765 [Candidatus Bathyarchaeum tardum]WNZ29301.1 MAG: hypothetical protein IAX21_00050 [Candidatus Bathyarchaeota archaeon]